MKLKSKPNKTIGKSEEDILQNPQLRFGKLLSLIGKAFHREFSSNLKIDGLTPTQLNVLIELRKKEVCDNNEAINQATLAEILAIAPISLTRLIERMEKLGFVKRIADENDKRAKIIQLNHQSPAVQNIILKMREVAVKANQKALKGFTKKNQELFTSMLEKVKSNLN